MSGLRRGNIDWSFPIPAGIIRHLCFLSDLAGIPTQNVVVGAAMILGAGLIIIVSEKLRRRIAA
nr:hypothetical protein [Rhizobium leguminosarum]